MDRMILLMVGVLALMPVPAAHAEVDRWGDFIAEAAHRFALPEPWIRAVMRAESGGRSMADGRPITSSAGAMGLMQVMPAAYEEMRNMHHLGPDPFDPRDNILAGTAYLRILFERYGYPGLFAAYNAGPERYERSLRGRPLPEETQAYLATVVENSPQPSSGSRLFVTLGNPADGTSSDLFVPPTVPGSRK